MLPSEGGDSRVETSAASSNDPSVNINVLKSNLEDLALDDWEDYDSD